tara:strand:+ start:589 stop:777 length:189 start_codon:yes stop_codon:yes gene_type:complete
MFKGKSQTGGKGQKKHYQKPVGPKKPGKEGHEFGEQLEWHGYPNTDKRDIEGWSQVKDIKDS